MVASRLKPSSTNTASAASAGGGGHGGEELKLLKQQMSALKLEHHAPTSTSTSTSTGGQEEEDQIKLLNQKIAQLKLLKLLQSPPTPDQEEEIVVTKTKRLLSPKDRLQCLRVKLEKYSTACLPPECRLLKLRALAEDARAISEEAKDRLLKIRAIAAEAKGRLLKIRAKQQRLKPAIYYNS